MSIRKNKQSPWVIAIILCALYYKWKVSVNHNKETIKDSHSAFYEIITVHLVYRKSEAIELIEQIVKENTNYLLLH
jgi:predicted negative regulator of RcsB-dependent stress response